MVTDIVLTHGDPDHAGGLADFPDAKVHISQVEYEQLVSGNPRYRPVQFEHGPRWKLYQKPTENWFEMAAMRVDIDCDSDVFLIPLIGHTLGHCGVAITQNDKWLLHVGDAYYLRAELETDDHPVAKLATMRAEDNVRRMESLEALRTLHREQANEITMFGYHDTSELD